MWKKIVGGIFGAFFVLRWSRRLLLASRLAAGRGARGAVAVSPAVLIGYLAISGGLLAWFALSDGGSTKRLMLAFAAVQVAAVVVTFHLV